jgi:hypothetical protein
MRRPDPLAAFSALAWRPGPPDRPGIWWVDCGAPYSRHTRYGAIAWIGPRATAHWIGDRAGVAKPARGEWPAAWRVALALPAPDVELPAPDFVSEG